MAHELIVLLVLFAVGLSQVRTQANEWVKGSPARRYCILESSGRRFTPWGFNYDHDEEGRLIEDYWETEWPKVEADFAQMKKLGANVVRVHLQLGKFMDSPDKANEKALDRLSKFVQLAETNGLYLDLFFTRPGMRPG